MKIIQRNASDGTQRSSLFKFLSMFGVAWGEGVFALNKIHCGANKKVAAQLQCKLLGNWA